MTNSCLTRARNFNRLARVYRWLEWCTLGPTLGKCRSAYLAEMKNCRAALVIGDGDGRFTAQLLKQNPHIAVDAVDVSDAMLRRLKQRAGRHARRCALTLPTPVNSSLCPTNSISSQHTSFSIA